LTVILRALEFSNLYNRSVFVLSVFKERTVLDLTYCNVNHYPAPLSLIEISKSDPENRALALSIFPHLKIKVPNCLLGLRIYVWLKI